MGRGPLWSFVIFCGRGRCGRCRSCSHGRVVLSGALWPRSRGPSWSREPLLSFVAVVIGVVVGHGCVVAWPFVIFCGRGRVVFLAEWPFVIPCGRGRCVRLIGHLDIRTFGHLDIWL